MARKIIEFSPTIPQDQVFYCESRFRALNAGRRFGKTYLANWELFTRAVNISESNNWYIAPTYKQAKSIAWADLKKIVPSSYITHKDETDLSLTLRNGSSLALRGSDNPDSLRGPGLNFVVLDEAAYQKKYAWEVVRPMLSDRMGSALFISTPAGFNWFYDLFMAAKARNNWSAFQFTTLEGGNVPPEEIEEAKTDLDPRTFRQEYLASFEALSGRVYYAFDRNLSVGQFKDNKDLPLLVGMDFNVNPMCAAIANRVADQIHFFDEIVIPNGNTELMAKTIRERFGKNRPVRVYPDPTGNARKTSAPVGQTDFTILRSAGFQVLAPSHPYPVSDKINTVNAAFLNAAGKRRAFANPAVCRELTKGFDGLTFKDGTSEPDKSLGLDHITDAAAYLLMWEIPMIGMARSVKLGAA